MKVLFDEGQALAYAVQVFLCDDRPSDALLKNGHGNAVDRRRRLEEDGICHSDGRAYGKKTRRELCAKSITYCGASAGLVTQSH